MQQSGRKTEILRPIWQFYRWFDGLEKRGFGVDRFIVFMSILVAALCLPGLVAVTFGYDFMRGQILGYMILCFLGLTRIYWIERYKR